MSALLPSAQISITTRIVSTLLSLSWFYKLAKMGTGIQTDLTRGDMDDPIAALLKATDQYGNEVDALIGLKGLDPQAFSRIVSVPFQGTTLRVIGREDSTGRDACG